ncbi:hypothetical protein PR003_g17477 [Phytophthora rubi]|uniref:Uncharacterized protein n=1 Tax=Phytophthora rubi TaxID=129364 RepID=A0A6A4EG29_9STRA|nr:hypothetical protein PR002_g21852 [Phytophthora rubi]KAE9321423.1 hypothetical protein PR003_g17477 [Phytophthora rubi]
MPASATKRHRASPEGSSVVTRRRTSDDAPVSLQTRCDQDDSRASGHPVLGVTPRTRSGRAVLPGVVNEAVTIQVTPLAEFQLSPPVLTSSASQESVSAASSQRTVTDPSPPASPEATTPATTLRGSPSRLDPRTSSRALWSPQSPFVEGRRDPEVGGASSVTSSPTSTVAASSQTSTVAPWSPQSPFNRLRRHRTIVVPLWFAEVFESDGYDSEALELIGSPAPPRRSSVTPSTSSSPGFAVVGAPRLTDLMAEWRLEPWPSNVKQLVTTYNPQRWKFPGVSAGVTGGVSCGCERSCAASTCLNAASSRFCTEFNCTFGGGVR